MNIEESYRYCFAVSRSKAKNFYYSFLFLPKRKRKAISAIYAFMRTCDDITDNPSSIDSKKSSLNEWKEKVQNFLKGSDLSHPVFPALKDTIHFFEIPNSYFIEIIEGVEMDLSPCRFQNFDELYSYCYKVASIVGLICLHIFGFQKKAALEHGEYCGIAFQMTNILRDLKEDAQMGRIYLPLEDLAKFGYTESDLIHGRLNKAFFNLMKFEVERTEAFYKKAEPLVHLIDSDSRSALKVMIAIYHGILNKIKNKGYDTLTQRISLTPLEKFKMIILSLF
jgi:phytoene synthase